jgi:hypothetical protein
VTDDPINHVPDGGFALSVVAHSGGLDLVLYLERYNVEDVDGHWIPYVILNRENVLLVVEAMKHWSESRA